MCYLIKGNFEKTHRIIISFIFVIIYINSISTSHAQQRMDVGYNPQYNTTTYSINFHPHDTTDITKFPQYWISFGMMGVFGRHNTSVNYTISTSYAFKNQTQVSLRYIRPVEITTIHNKSIQEVALLYGIMTDGEVGQASISGGLGWSFRANRPSTPGLVIQAKGSVTLPIIGVGIKGYAHFSGNPLFGAGLFIEIGKLSI